MSDFLDEILSAPDVVEREISIGGRKGTVFVRRISAGERAQLLAGQVVTTGGTGTTMEIDLSANEVSKRRMVYFAIATEDGKRRFKSEQDVAKTAAHVVEALYKVAADVNREDADEAGNG